MYEFGVGFPGGSVIKNLPDNTGDLSLFPGSGRSLGEGNGNPLWCSCLENPMDRGAWQDTAEVTETHIQIYIKQIKDPTVWHREL